MPFIKLKTNISISKKDEINIKSFIGKAIEAIPGKSEKYVLLDVEDNHKMWLRGKDDPLIYIEASIYGNDDHYGFETFAKDVSSFLSDELGIPLGNVYIKFEDIGPWSVGGYFING